VSESILKLLGYVRRGRLSRTRFERAGRRSPLNASAGYDEAPSVVPRSELGDRPNPRARSSCRRRPFCAQLRSASGADDDRCVRALSGTVK
jgi:hypothetical protein